jgi:hypothetical protein
MRGATIKVLFLCLLKKFYFVALLEMDVWLRGIKAASGMFTAFRGRNHILDPVELRG